ncbi:unannotated protein [freshwater metagenome]|uniref:Unannotated protein n=1 Tax=freshwater metagenome TaxID=449393 RepID=A0A6J7M5F9_9ZZZZ
MGSTQVGKAEVGLAQISLLKVDTAQVLTVQVGVDVLDALAGRAGVDRAGLRSGADAVRLLPGERPRRNNHEAHGCKGDDGCQSHEKAP